MNYSYPDNVRLHHRTLFSWSFLSDCTQVFKNSHETKYLYRQWLCSLIISFLVLCGFLIFVPEIFADSEDVVTGRAAVSAPNARKAALQAAFREAIENNVGVQVSSETLVKKANILVDEIYTYAEGYIASWDILEETVSDSQLVLRVRVTVRDGRLNKALFLNGLNVHKVYAWVGEPRVLILSRETIDGQSTDLPYVQSALEEAFLEKGIQVVHSEQLKFLQQRDQDLSGDEPKAAMALGKRLGTEIVVTATAQANFSRAIPISNYTLNFYTADLVVRAYNTATGTILHSGRYRLPKNEDTSAMGKRDAAGNAIRRTVATAGPEILFKIVSTWYDSFSRPANYQVVINNLSYSQLTEIKIYLSSLAGMRKVIERSYSGRTGELDLRYEGIGESLIQDIMASGKPLTIERKEQNRVILKYR
jgi:hypothetical protein